MKILWLSHVVPYPPKGGYWQRSYNLLKQIGKNNYVHLVSLNKETLLPRGPKLDDAKTALKSICNAVDIFPIKYEKSLATWGFMAAKSYLDDKPYDVNWLKNEEMLSFMIELSKSGGNSFDIIHLDTLGLYPFSLPFKKSRKVLNHHNIESGMMRLRYERERNIIKKIYFKKEAEKIEQYEKMICNLCDLNLVVSDLDASRLIEIAGDVQITVIANGVDLEYFKPKKLDDEVRRGLIFAGGMAYYANREAALFFVTDIWPKLNKVYSDIPVRFIGRNPPKELLELTKGTNIEAPGFVEDVRPYFDKSKIYICPIKNGGGTRLKIIDALAMCKPLIATEMAVEGLNLVDGEHYLRAESGEDFVNRVQQLVGDENLCGRLVKAGREYVERYYSWNVIGEKMHSDYSSLLNK